MHITLFLTPSELDHLKDICEQEKTALKQCSEAEFETKQLKRILKKIYKLQEELDD